MSLLASPFLVARLCAVRHVKVSASLPNVECLAVGAFDLVNCSLSVVGFVSVFHVCQQVS